MKKIGLIGRISWVSTVDYYRYLNENVNQRLDGMNYAEMIIYYFNSSLHLQSSGAELLVLGANTIHVTAAID